MQTLGLMLPESKRIRKLGLKKKNLIIKCRQDILKFGIKVLKVHYTHIYLCSVDHMKVVGHKFVSSGHTKTETTGAIEWGPNPEASNGFLCGCYLQEPIGQCNCS